MTGKLYDKFQNCSGVSTDTRQIKNGNMFFALKGPNFDANRFANEALEKGASWVVIDDAAYQYDPRHILVDDTLKALQELAVFHRNRLKIPFIGITGSNGKTTTKELINCVLSVKYKTVATSGNLNNHIGVPLTVLSVNEQTEVAIIEMGANKPGDIKELCDIANPTHGIITSIGKAHIKGFGSIEGVLKTKTELFDHLLKNNGSVFINSANRVFANMIRRFETPVLYPGEKDFYHCELVKSDPYVTYKSENGESVNTNLIGGYNFDNIAAALSIGKFFGVEEQAANEAVAGYVPSNMRSQVIRKGNNTIILDAYNANPGSMEAALNTLSGMPAENKIAILGDMLELGNIAEEEHANIGRLTASLNLDEVYFSGVLMAFAHAANSQSEYFRDKKDLEEFLDTKKFDNAAILVKASRGMQLETVNNHIHPI